MSTTNCNDFCTKQECFELKELIDDLQQQIINLTNELNQHVLQSIPEAHDFVPEVKVNNVIENGELIIDVTVNSVNDFSVVPLPDSIVPVVDVQVLPQASDEYLIRVSVNDVSDEDYLILPNMDVAVGVFDIDETKVAITVQVGENQDEDILFFPTTEETESNLSINGSFSDNTLNLIVDDGESQSSVDIPINIENSNENEHVISNLSINGSFRNDTLNLTVADGESFDSVNISVPTNDTPQTIFVTEEIYMNCDELEFKIDNCCSQILNSISSLENVVIAEVEDSENNINNRIDGFKNEVDSDLSNITDITTETKEQVTIDISGIANSEYSCKFDTDDDGKSIPGYAVSNLSQEGYEGQKNYSGTGLQGIHENLKIINSNLDSIYNDVCKSIDPISSISVNDLYTYCAENFEINRNDYFDELGNPKYVSAAQDFNEAIENYLINLLQESKYGYLIDQAIDDKLITAPTNWIAPILADFALIQGKINNEAICNIEIPEVPDVVSIVASDKVLDKYEGKTLVREHPTFATKYNYSAIKTTYFSRFLDT